MFLDMLPVSLSRNTQSKKSGYGSVLAGALILSDLTLWQFSILLFVLGRSVRKVYERNNVVGRQQSIQPLFILTGSRLRRL
mmetsp:Transcript_21968/g.51847  ORF Transcript_21968/g.51847 Transcript_21968/m.51847 type:complete len:81 (+) Transcript_21968:124-366(+)